MASGPSIFITGANRGIGLEFVRQSLTHFNPAPAHVFATYRDPSTLEELRALASNAGTTQLHLIQLDVRDTHRFPEIATNVLAVVGDSGLHLLVNNAGEYHASGQGLEQVSKDMLMSVLEVNFVGGLLLTQALLPALKTAAAPKGTLDQGRRPLVLNISSARFGSIAGNCIGGKYATRATRAAINSVTKSLSVDLKPFGVSAIAISPGWVRTAQGGSDAQLVPLESVAGMLHVIENLNEGDSGKFLQWDGQEVPW